MPRTCIYCDQERPFTDEHVFPAGLGGDDRHFLLKELVCGHCNTEVFSKFETRFMRSSPAALGRIFLQPRGRGKGKNASIPTIDTRTTTIDLTVADHTVGVEAEILAGGKAVTLMQFLFISEDKVGFAGGDHASVVEFIEAIERTVAEEILVVEKRTDGKKTVYHVEQLRWEQGSYKHFGSDTVDKPPKACVWREPLPTPSNRCATLYQRTAKQIVLRLPVGENPAPLLAQARRAVKGLEGQQLPEYASVENPVVQVSMSMQLSDYGRVLAKIGVNLVAHLFGEDYVRHHAFNRIKSTILTDAGRINVAPAPAMGVAFSGVPSDRHVLTLVAQKAKAGRFFLVLAIRLYGSTSLIHLTSNALRPPIEEPVFFVVDYNSHVIEELNAEVFAARYPPDIPDTPENAITWESVFGTPLNLDFART